ncbi:MAG: hypothetical protein IT317_14530 [Anaerolineales bacterium]|nr:hypothetical protein [Anaerolineales bacterium]
MNDQTVLRLGSIAAVAGLLLSIGGFFSMTIVAVGALVLAVAVFAFYRLYRQAAPGLSLVGAIIGIGGAVVMAISVIASNGQSNMVVSIATWTVYFLPPLVFGYLAYQHPEAGLPRLLGIIGMVGGVFGLLNTILVMIGGGDYANPNNPALSPYILGTYYLGMLPVLVWMVWSAIALMRLSAAPQRQPP